MTEQNMGLSSWSGTLPKDTNNYENNPLSDQNILAVMEQPVSYKAAKSAAVEMGKKAAPHTEGSHPQQCEPCIVTGSDLLLSAVTAPQFLIYGLIPKSGLIALVGSSDCGKSMFLRQAAIAVTTGGDFMGMRIEATYKAALMVLTEDDQLNLAPIFKRQADGKDPKDLGRLSFLFSPEDPLKEVDDFLTKNKADIVFVDAWGDVAGCDPRDNGKVRQALHAWNIIARRHGIVICFLHHTGKNTDNREPSKHSVIGAQSFEGKMRLVLELRKSRSNPDERLLTVLKANYMPHNEKTESRVLSFDAGATFLFGDTGERIPIELLSRAEQHDNKREKYDQIVELKAAGKTTEQIAQSMGWKSKASVSEFIKRYSSDSETTC